MRTFKVACGAFGIVSVIGVWGSPVAADWQYTKWGMTPEEVKAASGGTARANTDRKLDAKNAAGQVTEVAKLVAPYKSGSFSFQAAFSFDQSNKLSTVNLKLVSGGDCSSLLAQLSSAYGPGQSKSRDAISHLEKWWDQKNKNIVIYLRIGSDFCTIQYTPIASAGKPGGL